MSFFFQAEDGIRDLVRSRGLGDVYKRQEVDREHYYVQECYWGAFSRSVILPTSTIAEKAAACLLYTSDAADERSSVDLGGRRIIKKKNREHMSGGLKR